jgi:ketol-acid reductoisomerase
VTGKKILFDSDLDTSVLHGKQIALIGYGAQGLAQAHNLRDSGFTPLIGSRKGKSFEKAKEDGFETMPIAEAAAKSDIAMVLTPDETHQKICEEVVFPNLTGGGIVGFGAGFTVHSGLVTVPAERLTAILVAPKGPGRVLRDRYLKGSGIPALVAAQDDRGIGLDVAMGYAKALGCGRAGVVKTTFREEAIADLFGEQCVLSGGMIELMKAAFDVLVDRGYSPEVAYIECIAEVEYMASLISSIGLEGLDDHISSTAYFGGATRGRRIIDEGSREKLASVLDEIENGEFLEEFKRFARESKRAPLRTLASEALKQARSGFKENA